MILLSTYNGVDRLLLFPPVRGTLEPAGRRVAPPAGLGSRVSQRGGVRPARARRMRGGVPVARPGGRAGEGRGAAYARRAVRGTERYSTDRAVPGGAEGRLRRARRRGCGFGENSHRFAKTRSHGWCPDTGASG